uniref:Uncharacterized protein n=1 Tax=Ditylenchus dipsaci TaxID=166011 RepID=A0A915DM50_9BILA
MHTRSHANKRDYRAASSDGHRRRQTITALDSDLSGVSRHTFFDEPPTHTSGDDCSRHNLDSPSEDNISQKSFPTAEHNSNETDKSTSMSGYSSKLVDALSRAGGRRWRPSTAKFMPQSSSSSNRATTSYGRGEEVADTDEFHSLMHQSAMAVFDEDMNIHDEKAEQEVKKRLSSSSFKIFRSRASSEGRHRHRQNKKGSQYEE